MEDILEDAEDIWTKKDLRNEHVPTGHDLDGAPPKMEPYVYLGEASRRILPDWPKLTSVSNINAISDSELWIQTELPVEALDHTVAKRASDMTQYAMGRLIAHFWTLLTVDQIREMQMCFMKFAVMGWDEMKTSDNLSYDDYMQHLQRFEEAYPVFKCGIQFLPEEYEHFKDLALRKEALTNLENNCKKNIHPKPDKKRLNYINSFVDYALDTFATLALHIESKSIAQKQMRFFDHHLAGAVKLWKDRVISDDTFEFSVRHVFQFSAPWALFVEVDNEFEKFCAIRRRERELANLKLVPVDLQTVKRGVKCVCSVPLTVNVVNVGATNSVAATISGRHLLHLACIRKWSWIHGMTCPFSGERN